MQGASPLASPGWAGRGTGEGGDFYFISPGATAPGTPAAEPGRQNAVLAGGLVSWLPDLLAVSVVFCPLSPQPPSRREGGDLGYFMQGASPLASPGLGGTLHWGRGRTTRPAEGVPGWLSAYPAFAFFSAPYPLPRWGRGRFLGYFMQGASPLASPGLNLYGAGSTLGKQFLLVMSKTFPFNNIIEKSSGGLGDSFKSPPAFSLFFGLCQKPSLQ